MLRAVRGPSLKEAILVNYDPARPRSQDAPSSMDFLRSGGEMGELMRAHNWSASSLGPPSAWPQSLRTVVRLMLNTGHPMYIWWGTDGACLYNDAYRKTLGPERHPGSLGRPALEVWREIWDVIGPQINQVMSGGGATWHEDQLVPITRHGRREDIYWTYSFSPIDEDSAPGGVGGVMVVCSETTQRVLAKRRIDAEIARQRRLFQCAPGFIAVLTGPDHIFEFVNDAYIRLLGKRDFIGMPVRVAAPEVEGQGYFELLDRVFSSGQRFVAEAIPIRLNRVAGGAAEERFLDFIYEPITDETGRVTGIFVEGFDVTARAHSEAAQRESERRLRELNANLEREVMERSVVGGRFWQISPDLLCVLNPDGCLERANPAWLTLLGWTEAEVQKVAIFDLLDPDDREPTRRIFEYLKRGNPILHFENRYRHKSGGYKWFAWAAAPLGEAYYCSGRDITSERDQAAALAQSNLERDRVWTNSRDLLLVVGADGIFRAVSPAWTSILGHDLTDVIGHSFRDFVWPEDAELTQSRLDRAASTLNLTNFENRYRHKDGMPRWISWHTSVEGDLVYAYGRDVTAEKEAQGELARAQDALRQAQKMEAVGQLTGGLAHDFNNLLAGISGSVEVIDALLARGRLGEIKRYITAAQSSTRRAAALTQRLLAFSRRQTLDPKPTDANRLIGGMEELIRRTVGPDVELDVVSAQGLWLTKVDSSQLENSLLNLCINARDAMAPDGGRLTIETANESLDQRAAGERELSPGQYISLSVADSGTGMAPEVIARAFDPFFTTKPLGEGTGLGLSMVYGFARQSGGQVRIYSQLGKGTTMCLYLPRYLGTMEASDPDLAAGTAEAGAGETVLVIDDEPTLRMLITEMLRDNGYEALEASDGMTGLKLLQSDRRIDLLITDVGLPGGMNGRQIADAARISRSQLKVLFITGYAENALVGSGRLEPGMEIVTKPFVLAELASRVRNLIDR
jgi:PAS domain S-box-containing protein